MREEEYIQCINFGLLINCKIHNQTIPIVLAIDDKQKLLLSNIQNGDSNSSSNDGDVHHFNHNHNHVKKTMKSVALKYNDKIVAILDDYEIFAHRKEERAASVFKTTNPGHPSIKLIMDSGDWLIGGDLKVFERITWNDGLDHYRLTPKEIRAKLKEIDVRI